MRSGAATASRNFAPKIVSRSSLGKKRQAKADGGDPSTGSPLSGHAAEKKSPTSGK